MTCSIRSFEHVSMTDNSICLAKPPPLIEIIHNLYISN